MSDTSSSTKPTPTLEPPQSPSPSRKRVVYYRLPFLILFPTSVLFFTLDQMLANVSGGHDSSEYFYSTFGLGSSPGYMLFILALFIGTFSIPLCLLYWIEQMIKQRRFLWPGLMWLTLGILAHPWIFGYFWDYVESLLVHHGSS